MISVALLSSSSSHPSLIYNTVAQDQLEQQAVSSKPELEPNLLQQNFTNTIKPELPSDLNTTKVQKPGSVLKLEDQKVAVDIPLQKAYENGSEIYFIVTDA